MGSHRWILNEWHPAARKSPVTFVHRVRESGLARSTQLTALWAALGRVVEGGEEEERVEDGVNDSTYFF
jgi:hypothetical protein